MPASMRSVAPLISYLPPKPSHQIVVVVLAVEQRPVPPSSRPKVAKS
jgi:hypothetical protein